MKNILFIGISVLLLLYIPFLILGEGSYIRIHDNLDSEFIYLHILKINNKLLCLGDYTIPNVFNGLEKSHFHSNYNLIRIIFYLLPSFWAYILNSFIIKVIGLFGMTVLIVDYFRPLKDNNLIILLISLVFALLPVYSLYGISVLGQPLLLWAFLNLNEKRRLYVSGFIIAAFPFYSHFAMTAPFVLAALFIFALANKYWYKTIVSKYYWYGILLLLISYLVANFSNLYGFVFNETISHRTQWTNDAPRLLEVVKRFINTFIRGHYHSANYNSLPVFALALYSIYKKSFKWKACLGLLLGILGVCVIYSFYDYIRVPTEDIFPIFTTFQFNRFTFLLPLLWFLIILVCLTDKSISNKIIIIVVIMFGCLSTIKNNEIEYNIGKVLLPDKYKPERYKNERFSFEKFYSNDLFSDIKKYINLPTKDYKIVNLGFHPSISLYNGFYTLDGYQNNYPLIYKLTFRKIISSELEKNSKIKKYYDNWGSRCYLFSSELRETCYLSCYKDSNIEIDSLDINTPHLRSMGAEYIFSAVPINNYRELNLKYDRSFENNKSPLKIYLYKI